MRKIRKTRKFFISQTQEVFKIKKFSPFTEIKDFCPYKTRGFKSKNRKFSK